MTAPKTKTTAKTNTAKSPKNNTTQKEVKKMDNKKAVIIDTGKVTEESKSITQKLNVIKQNKEEIAKKRTQNTLLYSEIMRDIKIEFVALRGENEIYKKANNRVLAKLLKARYDSKDTAINAVLNVILQGLNIDNTMTISSVQKTLQYLKKGLISKSKINKLNKEDLLKELAIITKSELKAKYAK